MGICRKEATEKIISSTQFKVSVDKKLSKKQHKDSHQCF
jgi:hypothetical protein